MENPVRSPEVVDWHLQDAEKPWGCSCFAVPAARAELTRVQHMNHRAWCCAGRASSSKQSEIFSESALRALVRRNDKDFSVFSQAKCVPSCSEQTSAFGGCAAEASLELG